MTRANQQRVEFYKQKIEAYEKKFGDRQPPDSTIRRWVEECDQEVGDTTK